MTSNLIAICSKSVCSSSVFFNTPELSYKKNKKKKMNFSLSNSFTIVIDNVEIKVSSQLNVAKSIRKTRGII
jgi:hypothetical protein